MESEYISAFSIYFIERCSMKGVAVHFKLGTCCFSNNVDAMVIINIVSWRSRETERYVVKATSGIFLAGEPGRWYVTSFDILCAGC